jgi:hypothetical protein
MPCRSDYPDEPTVLKTTHDDVREQLDTVTRLLCGLCRRVKQEGKDELIVNDHELGRWWVKHEAWDKKREKEELALAAAKAKKQTALNKLSAEEKKILGL